MNRLTQMNDLAREMKASIRGVALGGVAAAAVLVGGVPAAGAILATYDFDNGTTDAAISTEGQALGLTASAISNGGGLKTFVVQDTDHSSNYLRFGLYDDLLGEGDTVTAHFDVDHFIELTLTAGATPINLTSIGTSTRKADSGSSSTYLLSVIANDAPGSVYGAVLPANNGFEIATRDLTGLTIAANGSVTLQLVHHGRNNRELDLDDVVIEGVAVPEPASLALLGLGGMLIGLRRR